MASSRYASYLEEEDWDLATLELVNSHLEKYLKMVGGPSVSLCSPSESFGTLPSPVSSVNSSKRQRLIRKQRQEAGF